MRRWRLKTITYDNYLRLLGLLTLAADHRREMEAIERSACAITGEEPGSGGHTGEAVWGEKRIEHLLTVLDITVEERSQ